MRWNWILVSAAAAALAATGASARINAVKVTPATVAESPIIVHVTRTRGSAYTTFAMQLRQEPPAGTFGTLLLSANGAPVASCGLQLDGDSGKRYYAFDVAPAAIPGSVFKLMLGPLNRDSRTYLFELKEFVESVKEEGKQPGGSGTS